MTATTPILHGQLDGFVTSASSKADCDDYDRLPEVIRQYYTKQEYLWMSDTQKAKLQQSETEPDWEE